jgi:hypothetical protein
MTTKHAKYKYMDFPSICPDGHDISPIYAIWTDYKRRASVFDFNAPGLVRIICRNCGQEVHRWTRDKELDANPGDADKERIGQTIEFLRAISWVGYAKNPDTVPVTYDQEQGEVAVILAEFIEGTRPLKKYVDQEWTFSKDDGDPMRQIIRERLNQGVHGPAIARNLGRYARYRIRGRAYGRADNHRSLWYRYLDAVTSGTIVDVVTCWTGRQYSPSVYGTYDQYDYEPGGLDNATFHRLYAIETDTRPSFRCLVHPIDIKMEVE